MQGVFFRAFAKEKAEQLNLKGFVRNEPDGAVYVEAEGEAEMLDAFVLWCRKGPPRAEVSGCRVTPGTLKNFGGFTIER